MMHEQKLQKDESMTFSTVGNLMVAAWTVFPGTLLAYSEFTGNKLPLLFYYPGLEILPLIFIVASGNASAYLDILRGEAARGFVKTMAACATALVVGWAISHFIICVITWNMKNTVTGQLSFMAYTLDSSLWIEGFNRDLGFLLRNPLSETFFFRVFLHRELAVRFFPSKDAQEEQLLQATQGTAVLPKLSTIGACVLALSWGLYHIVPTIITNTPIFAPAGYTYATQCFIVFAYLCPLGYWFVHMRESKTWGLMAQWAWHIGIDIQDVWLWSVVGKLTKLAATAVT
eukprot:gnl/MRDRNA2_/MRDRNA2_81831_c0_seq1.p1 gnl/MRDRNA2_/MRDRNA2_81831_c0~~gnl/MRDRNA2_/MRDRNA2_81831_c0_seq1.p1  ORF type:complete len:287 (-),score=42.05 gnl/MRDRNA2_/MRDRNA2_81831_c0_seq1:105-965(-)